MALYIPHSIFHLARLLYVRPETFGPYHILRRLLFWCMYSFSVFHVRWFSKRQHSALLHRASELGPATLNAEAVRSSRMSLSTDGHARCNKL